MSAGNTHRDPEDGLTVHDGEPRCDHVWAEICDEMEGDRVITPAHDVCVNCGGVKW